MMLFDDLFDELPLHHSLRIPSLVDPPLPPVASDRPSPLEPNARSNVVGLSPWEPNARVMSRIDKEKANLTRQKALAEAKPLGDSTANDLPPLRDRTRNKQEKLHDFERIADFVHLPIPTAKDKKEKLPPYQPIPVLNQLHQPPPPPPSASLFPPITPTPTSSQQVPDRLETSRKPAQSNIAVEVETKKKEKQVRRYSNRPRARWTERETKQLIQGVIMFGQGKWKQILYHAHFSWPEGRTTIGLKDRFRTLYPRGFPPPGASHADPYGQHVHDSSDSGAEQEDDQPTFSPGGTRRRRRQKGRRVWTEGEDEALVNGHKRYGFQWALMAQDPTLNFVNRTGPQVRDRFRLKFPDIYAQEAAVPIDPRTFTNGKIRPGGGRAASRRIQLSKSNSEARELDKIEDPEPRSQESIITSVSNPSAIAPVTATAPYSITDLLNDDESEDNRPMAGASSFLDEVEDNRPSNSLGFDYCDVTLPPLMLNWEDMATRPIFELE